MDLTKRQQDKFQCIELTQVNFYDILIKMQLIVRYEPHNYYLVVALMSENQIAF